MKKYFLLITSIVFYFNLTSQNLGFESGKLDGWVYKQDNVKITPLINFYNSGCYITKSEERVHDEINQPAKFPDGGRYSLMIGTFDRGRGNTKRVHSIEKEINIESDDLNIPLYYSLYFETHDGYFRISVFDSSNVYYNLYSPLVIGCLECPRIDFRTPSHGWFKKWTPNIIKLKNLKGKKVTLKIEVSGCSQGGHAGLMWIDFKCYNPNLKLKTFQCKDELTLQLKSNTFNQVLDINKNNLFDFAGEKTKINLQTHKPHYLVGFNDTSCAEEIPISIDKTYGLKAECNNQICLNDSLELNIQSNVYDKFTLDFAGEIRLTQDLKIKHKFKKFGTNKIILISTDSFCSDTIYRIINVLNNKHSLNFVEFGCIGDTFLFKKNTITNILKIDYLWSVDDNKYYTDHKSFIVAKVEDSLLVHIFSEDNNLCKDTSSGLVIFNEKPNSNFKFNMVNIDEYYFQPTVINHKFTYSWFVKDDTLNQIYFSDKFVDKYFSITLNVSENQCFSTTKKYISNDTLYVFIPNAFYPKTSNFNPSINHTAEYEMIIYNRWGEMIFKTNNLKEGWDGNYNETECQQDTYIYLIELKDYKGKPYKYRGTISLLR
jgi:gliding motility-associated-like protein